MTIANFLVVLVTFSVLVSNASSTSTPTPTGGDNIPSSNPFSEGIPRHTTTTGASSARNLHEALHAFQNDLTRVKNLPETSLTIPCDRILYDSSYTKFWTFEDWEVHQSLSLRRYTKHASTWILSTTAHHILPTVCVVALWAYLVSRIASLYPKFHLGTTRFTIALTFITSPILLMLTLRTNRSLERLLDSRKAWGILARATRTFMGLVCVYIIPHNPDAGFLIARYLSFMGWALKAILRKEDDDTEMIQALFANLPNERDWLLNGKSKRPTCIVFRLRYLLSVLGRDIPLSSTALLRMEEMLSLMEQSVGICLRVLTSPIPPTYTRHTSRVLVMYMTLLPIALVGMDLPTVPVIIISVFASYVLVGIDEIGLETEHPFQMLPMQTLASRNQDEVENQAVMLSTVPTVDSSIQ